MSEDFNKEGYFKTEEVENEGRLHKDLRGLSARVGELDKKISSIEEDTNAANYSLRSIKISGYVRNVCIILLLLAFVLNCFGVLKASDKKAILSVCLYDEDEAENISDSLQVYNALKYGGQIAVIDTSTGFKNAFGSKYGDYGANNGKGSYFIYGAMLNYIASKGWTLVQAPTTGLTRTYYFEK